MHALTLALAFAAPPDRPTIRVPMAAHDLEVGTQLDRNDLDLTTTLPDFVPDVAVTRPEELIGRVVREPIYAGEMFRPERLTLDPAPPGITAVVPQGMQLLRLEPSLPTPAVAPSGYVDVLDGKRFCVLVEAAWIMGVEGADGRIETRRTPEQVVAWHLAVTPAQAQSLLGATTFTLALRNDIDVVSRPDLLCDAPAPAP